ncbi:MAG TPA: iron-hydroxamate ABC transporter substrate-binding protein [Pseudogracilibacillus sp.]|nr:iron-hydroxamate ABC transporter substrate-binding protein [Pseudogracilibacillus sp.]
MMRNNLVWTLLLGLLLIVSACAGDKNNQTDANEKREETETTVYEAENGDIEVPKDPERVVMLSGFTGNVLELGVDVVGADVWSMDNPTFEEELTDAKEVSDEDLEEIIELEPDLIIGLSDIKNVDKLQEIAPTVTYTWGELDYLEQHIEIGKLLNKEEEAREWTEDFEKRMEETGKEIKDKIGEDKTVSVMEAAGKELYVYGDNWARGTEILYQGLDLDMPDKVEEEAQEEGYYSLSEEVIPDFAGDYIILSKYPDADTSFEDTELYRNIPAVKEDRVFEMDGRGASFSDPMTLEKQLDFIRDAFLDADSKE